MCLATLSQSDYRWFKPRCENLVHGPPFTCFSFHITVTLCSASFVLCGTCSEELKVEIKGLYVLFFAAIFIRKEIQSVKASELLRAIREVEITKLYDGNGIVDQP